MSLITLVLSAWLSAALLMFVLWLLQGFVAKLHLRRVVLWSLPVLYDGQRGRTTLASGVQGAHCPQDIMLMGVRWEVASPWRDRQVAARMEERGGPVAHATIPRGVVTARGRVPIVPIRLPAKQGVTSPCVSTCATDPLCRTTVTGGWPRHWRDTQRDSGLASANGPRVAPHLRWPHAPSAACGPGAAPTPCGAGAGCRTH